MDSLEVEVDVGEAYIARVQPGMPVEAVLNAYPEWKIPAEVIAIIPTADRGKATVKVRIALHSNDARIIPDMGVRVGFLESRLPDADTSSHSSSSSVLVPASAVIHHNGQDTVLRVGSDNMITRHTIHSGRMLGTDREVLDGLASGDMVVISPSPELTDGDMVTISAAH